MTLMSVVLVGICISISDGPEIWFRDLNGRWSFLAETFANYYRMMITHLGIVSWQVSNRLSVKGSCVEIGCCLNIVIWLLMVVIRRRRFFRTLGSIRFVR